MKFVPLLLGLGSLVTADPCTTCVENGVAFGMCDMLAAGTTTLEAFIATAPPEAGCGTCDHSLFYDACPGVSAPSPGPTFEHCANERNTCSCYGTVRFGKEGSWLEMEAAGDIGCNRGVFGSDPAVGYLKTCECAGSATEPILYSYSYDSATGDVFKADANGYVSKNTASARNKFVTSSATEAAGATVVQDTFATSDGTWTFVDNGLQFEAKNGRSMYMLIEDCSC